MTPAEFGLLIAAAILAVVGYMILFVKCGPHQGECEHGVEPEYCPDCQMSEFKDCYSAPSSTSVPSSSGGVEFKFVRRQKEKTDG